MYTHSVMVADLKHCMCMLSLTAVLYTYHTQRAEHEAEGYHGSRPPLGECIAAAVVVKHVATRQLDTEHEEREILLMEPEEILMCSLT